MISRNKELILKIVGWLQIIGGLTGLFLVCNLLLQTGAINGALLLIFLTGIGLFMFSLYAGRKLLKVKERIDIIYSFINQALQLFQWSLLGYGLNYSSGVQASIGFKGLALTFDCSIITSAFEMHISSGDEQYVKLNVIAAIIILVLSYIYRLKNRPVEIGK